MMLLPTPYDFADVSCAWPVTASVESKQIATLHTHKPLLPTSSTPLALI